MEVRRVKPLEKICTEQLVANIESLLSDVCRLWLKCGICMLC